MNLVLGLYRYLLIAVNQNGMWQSQRNAMGIITTLFGDGVEFPGHKRHLC